MRRGYKINEFFKIWCERSFPHQDMGPGQLAKRYNPIASYTWERVSRATVCAFAHPCPMISST